ncbi:unnamed protein product [Pieris macdunnoughi]|uniref:Uncharacterized protein n=1 Tax=Pieris macdunnoughi TaxID=345717 RepID=A0A821LZK7_9NEOP|nr:unnamed protein product [Pieris macdunnoughi]
MDGGSKEPNESSGGGLYPKRDHTAEREKALCFQGAYMAAYNAFLQYYARMPGELVRPASDLGQSHLC